MGKIIITENMSLDGVVQDPLGEEGLGGGAWGQFRGHDREEWAKILTAEAHDAAALLLGRRSDAWFAARWLSRTGEWADRLNSMPKYVVSATLQAPAWSNSTILRGDVATAAARLKQEVDGDIVVYASTGVARALLDHDLADELRLIVYPVVAGAGQRLFGETGGSKPLRLVRAQGIGENLALLAYQPLT